MHTVEPLTLRREPQWHQAAQVLIDGCAYLKTAPERIRLLEALCDALGPSLYPALIGVLCVIGEHASPMAKQTVAQTLVEGLKSGRVPTGRRVAWGSSQPLSGLGTSMTRSLGPIEYLCAWYDDPGTLQPISASTFDAAMRAILSLVSESDEARRLYGERLLTIAQAPADGALTRRAIEGIKAMALSWQACRRDFQAPVNAFVQAASQPAAPKDLARRLMGLG